MVNNIIFVMLISLILGEYCGLNIEIQQGVWLIGMLLIGLLFYWRNSLYLKREKIKLALLVFLLGLLLGTKAVSVGDNYLGKMTNKELFVLGSVLPETLDYSQKGNLSFTLESEQVYGKEAWEETSGKIRVTILGENKKIENFWGKRLIVRGVLQPIVGFKNPGQFDLEEDARLKHIAGRMLVQSERVKMLSSHNTLQGLMAYINREIRNNLNCKMAPKHSSLMSGMLLGYKKKIDPHVKRIFFNTGMNHILAVSGAHMSIILGYLLFVLKKVRATKNITIFIFALVGFLYAGICNFTPGVLRALCMSVALLFSKGKQKKWSRENIFFAVAFLLLCLKPVWLLSPGFQLSFFATFGIIFILPAIEPWITYYSPRFLGSVIGIALSVQLAILPLVIYYFHKFSLYSILANIVVIPFFELAMFFTIVSSALFFVVPIMGTWSLQLASIFLDFSLWLLEKINILPFASCIVSAIPLYVIYLYYLGLWLYFGIYPLEKLSGTTRYYASRICLFLIIFRQCVLCFLPQPFTVYFLDVGQGDCALIRTPEKQNILVDTGGLKGGFDIGEQVVVPMLEYYGISKLDVIALSHGHYDHIGGAKGITQCMEVENVFLPNEEFNEELKAFLCALPATTNVRIVQSGEQFLLKKLFLEIIDAPQNTGGDLNDNSVIMKVKYDNNGVLFTGDATGEEELNNVEKYLQAKVLKVSHHGSKTSSRREFLEKVQPDLAVISCGKNNPYGHPHSCTLSSLEDLGITTLRTDTLGAIKVTFLDHKPQFSGYRFNKEAF